MIIVGLIFILFGIIYLRVIIKLFMPYERDWEETIATVLEERDNKFGELLTDGLEERELKIAYYVDNRQYIKYVSCTNWQVGEEKEVYIRTA